MVLSQPSYSFCYWSWGATSTENHVFSSSFLIRCLCHHFVQGLVRVKLSTSSLERLSLMNCKKVSSLELSCPVLHHLHLDGCDHLIEASFAPVGLQTLNLGICPHLTNLVIEADQMTALDLRGCGVLCQASIQCPRLLSLDASYCRCICDQNLPEFVLILLSWGVIVLYAFECICTLT